MTPTHRYYRYFTYIQPIFKIPLVKTYSGPIFSIITLTVLIIFAIKPTVETILVLQKRLEDSNQVLKNINQKTQNLSLAKKNYQTLDPAIKLKIQTAIPNQVELKTITLALEDIAKINNASVSAIQIQPFSISSKPTIPGTQKLQEILFTFNVEGGYQNLLNILSQMQKNIRVFSIDRLTMNKIEDNSNILMSISGKAYYLR